MSSHSVTQEVLNLSRSKAAREFERKGLSVKQVDWQDTARFKGSCWGPNITDVTLLVDGERCPIIGPDRFEDPTFDHPVTEFNFNVSNNEGFTSSDYMSLESLLSIMDQLIDTKIDGNLFLPRDSKILTSSQCCVLPLEDGEVDFSVALHNYQYDRKDPATLAILATREGTSIQLLTEPKQELYYNNKGKAHMLKAERLQDVRTKRHIDTTEPISQDEKERNVLWVYQIPLLISRKQTTFSYIECAMCAVPKSISFRGMDHAQIGVGRYVKKWDRGDDSITIKRDPNYPIRCTLQYYRVTDTSDIPSETISEISEQVMKIYNLTPSKDKGSLVTETTSRVTEPILPRGQVFFNF